MVLGMSDVVKPSFAVRVDRASKSYGARSAVRNVSLGVRHGEVYGLLGPNGAGKTTTLRMLLGLVRRDAGTIEVLGEAPGSPAALAQVGALVEEPALYPYLSGRANLRVLARYAGVDSARIDPALDMVGLRDRAGDKVRGYSLGMRQRLGVAAALLGDPRLLILDEPTNGLDPQGMASMRALIRSLGSGDRTVIVSSHLLGEVEQMCDRVAVMRTGDLLVEDDVRNLRGASHLLVRARPLEEAQALLADMAEVEDVQAEADLLRVTMRVENPAAVNRALVAAGVDVSELRMSQQSLEEVFMTLTGTETVA